MPTIEQRRHSVVIVDRLGKTVWSTDALTALEAWNLFSGSKVFIPGYVMNIYASGSLVDYKDFTASMVGDGPVTRLGERVQPLAMDREGYAGSVAGQTLVIYKCPHCGRTRREPDAGAHGPTCDHGLGR